MKEFRASHSRLCCCLHRWPTSSASEINKMFQAVDTFGVGMIEVSLSDSGVKLKALSNTAQYQELKSSARINKTEL